MPAVSMLEGRWAEQEPSLSPQPGSSLTLDPSAFCPVSGHPQCLKGRRVPRREGRVLLENWCPVCGTWIPGRCLTDALYLLALCTFQRLLLGPSALQVLWPIFILGSDLWVLVQTLKFDSAICCWGALVPLSCPIWRDLKQIDSALSPLQPSLVLQKHSSIVGSFRPEVQLPAYYSPCWFPRQVSSPRPSAGLPAAGVTFEQPNSLPRWPKKWDFHYSSLWNEPAHQVLHPWFFLTLLYHPSGWGVQEMVL